MYEYVVLVYGGERVLWISCLDFIDALNERDLRSGMGVCVEIHTPDAATRAIDPHKCVVL